jgi:Fe-S cluster biogenesis protein NfuA|tara:strand:- start:789 stop:1064 length:276 start_codon:yes stop_codon:yes gene_type:complete
MRTDEEVVAEIENLIEIQIQPSVAMHGGVVTLHSFKEGVATMFMSGACSGCGSSTQTLKMGIENLLSYHIPEVKSVEGVDDEQSEVAPYYS